MTKTATAQTGMTIEEYVETLTGLEEIEMEKQFGQLQLVTKDLRALGFIAFRRGGVEVEDAKAQALGMSRKDVKALFVAEDEDIDPDQPETDSGKGGSEPA